jgi:O-antigen/teichoic acid export membrane protein
MQTSPRAEGSLTSGYIWTFGATALPLVSAFMTSLIIARWMGPHIAGLINWTMALTTVFLILAKFGVDGAASRLVSEYQVAAPANVPRLIRLSLLLRLLFTLPVAALATIFAPRLTRFFGEPDLLPLVRLSGLLVLAVSLNELTALLVLGLQRFRLLFMVRVLMLLLRVGLVLAAALAALEARGVIGAFIIAALAPALGVLALLVRRRTPTGAPAGSGQIWRKLVKLAVPLAVSGASVTVYSLLDKLMLGKL